MNAVNDRTDPIASAEQEPDWDQSKQEVVSELTKWLLISAPDTFSMRDFGELTEVVMAIVDDQVTKRTKLP